MYKYTPHGGYFYCDIGDGSDLIHVDFCFILPEQSSRGVMIIKSYLEVAAYDFDELFNERENAKVLNYRKFETSDEAYSKMMKWIGKMVKKSVSFDNKHISRYFNNKSDDNYETPEFVSDQERMSHVYEWMESAKHISLNVRWFK